ncbi:hypothetical protein SAMN06265337_3016 [Hymenobacter gelipurpurascens]|uniref:4-amino-4-deoxy-L-arabinose transferase n=1 Tax=Hymenobacter gelipurpurascens TaxID=89968 RepID=A0A212UC25_9BACT|nr:DUF6056 family protein [Hymenobacter gelipurpurascens]SNC75710.1 hypothetical protein SAMN06265337_3016 [Hymenobacter gelipurpurascens]
MPQNSRFLFTRPVYVGVLLLALLPFLGLMCYAHPAIDDFDNAATAAKMGRGGALWYWYTHWSGRYVTIGLSTWLNPLSYAPSAGAAPAGLLVLRGMLLLSGAVLIASVQQFFQALLLVLPKPEGAAFPPSRLAWALALAVLALGLNALPEPFTLLYWYSGVLNYLLPLIFVLGFCAGALRTLHLPPGEPTRRKWTLVAGLCLVGAMGGGELSLLACGLLLVGLGVWVYISDRPSQLAARRVWWIWMVAGLVAAGLFLGAPGNWNRLGFVLVDSGADFGTWPHRLALLAPRTALATARLAARPPVAGALVILVGSIWLTTAGAPIPRPKRWELAGVLGVFVLLNSLGVAFLKITFMRDLWVEALPGRVVNYLVLQLLISTAALMLWARPWLPPLPPKLRAAVVLPALALLLLLTGQTRRAWQELLLVAPGYNQQMHSRYQILDDARRRHAPQAILAPLQLPDATGVLVPIPSARQRADVNLELSTDYTQKNNQLLAHYYGVPCVYLSAPPVAPQP